MERRYLLASSFPSRPKRGQRDYHHPDTPLVIASRRKSPIFIHVYSYSDSEMDDYAGLWNPNVQLLTVLILEIVINPRPIYDFPPKVPELVLLQKIEALQHRVKLIERHLGINEPLRPLRDLPEAEHLLNVLGIKVKDFETYLASPDLVFTKSDKPSKEGNWMCLAENCPKQYSRMSQLTSHIRSSPGRGHALLKSCIEEKYCSICQKEFSRLLRHEQEMHSERFDSRITRLLPHFGIFPRKFFC
jgi:hypothetical protein